MQKTPEFSRLSEVSFEPLYTRIYSLLSVSLQVKFGHGKWTVGSVYYARKDDIPLAIIIPAVIVPMLLFIAVSVYCYRFGKLSKEYTRSRPFVC